MSGEKREELTTLQQIVQHGINKEPSKMTDLINKELSARVMTHIDAKRAEVGKTLFGK